MSRDQILTASAVERLIADDQTIVIFEDAVLRLDGWMERHPGGRLAILHMVGRDATDEMKAYHSEATLRTMKAYRIGRKQGSWVNRTPPIRGGIFCKDATEGVEIELSDSSVASDVEESSDAVSSASSAYSSSGVDVKDKDGLKQRSVSSDESRKQSVTVRVANAGIAREIQKDLEEYPSLDARVQKDIAEKYSALHERVRKEGLYQCPYIEYGKEMVRYTTLFTLFATLFYYQWYIPSSIFLGLFWHQIMFSAHDAGHLAITSNFVVDTLIGMFIADFCCGLSIGWWKSSHNVHHLITNMPEHDPDIQNVPIFATCPSFFKSLTSTYYKNFVFVWDAAADLLVPYQKYTYYPIMAVARFNLYFLSWCHVLSEKSAQLGKSRAWWIRPTEITFMACYWFLFGYCLVWRGLPSWYYRVAFVVISHIVTMPLHVQITLSHWGMSTTDLGETESFAQRQLRTTMDVDCPEWLDWIHGGLQFQAVHHLFPRVPRHNLRKVQKMIREFCNDTGVPYKTFTFTEGNKVVLGRLQDVSDQLAVLIKCQQHMARTGESGLH
ncbi:hypothetical protein NW762_012558 [Fusarium torreyae]|uniref:Delta 8-(E)-sphingolipid desaturase n=1 Tax=Fusarium torreyae TaxID=1237075 RepID=A0A9W8RNM7_9HYPO|nr:hypothetical protein NW762_012558 [Fusarium torreyae]